VKLIELMDCEELRDKSVLRVEYNVKNKNWKAQLTRTTCENESPCGVGLTPGAAMDQLCNRIRGLTLDIDGFYKDRTEIQIPMNLTV
jgi:hypothetical protein